MMSRLRTCVATLALSIVPALVVGQVGYPPGRSPYRDIAQGSSITLTGGYFLGNGGDVGVGPNSGSTVGARFDLRAGKAVQLGVGVGYAQLERLIEDRKVHPLIRACGVETLGTMVLAGEAEREHVVGFCRRMLDGGLERRAEEVWEEIVSVAALLHPRELIEGIRRAVESGQIVERLARAEDAQDVLVAVGRQFVGLHPAGFDDPQPGRRRAFLEDEVAGGEVAQTGQCGQLLDLTEGRAREVG